MDVYLVRHAEAAPLDVQAGLEDPDRPLVPAGYAQAELVARTLARHGVPTDAIILSSPLLRARQTAERILQTWSRPIDELPICEDLAPDGKFRRIVRHIAALQPPGPILLVGHQPDLGEFVGWLIGSRKARIELPKAGVACVECSEYGKGGSRLRWMLTPTWMERLAPS